MEYSITQENLQKVLDYLVTRPWSESNSLIQLISKCKPVTQAPIINTPTLVESSEKETANG